MTDRERLIELLNKVKYFSVERAAETLLANGVTVQQWIPVTERLPEKNTSVIAATDTGIVFQCLYAYDSWDLWEDNEVNITHWMPLPEPPKEVEQK